MDEETYSLLRQLEDENGGKLIFKTYSLYLGKSGEGVNNLGGLLYAVNNRIIFEDFEKQGGMLQLLVKRQEKYEKTKFSFPVSDVSSVYTITRKNALKAVASDRNPSDIAPVPPYMKILFRTITQIRLKDGSAYYFELIDEKSFRDFVNRQA